MPCIRPTTYVAKLMSSHAFPPASLDYLMLLPPLLFLYCREKGVDDSAPQVSSNQPESTVGSVKPPPTRRLQDSHAMPVHEYPGASPVP